MGKKKDEELWELAVAGEDSWGRLFGFGKKSRTSKATHVLETLEADKSNSIKSTATSASDPNRKYSKDEVADLLAAERAQFVGEIVAQEKRHRAEIEEIQISNEYTRECFARLFEAAGCPPPTYKVST